MKFRKAVRMLVPAGLLARRKNRGIYGSFDNYEAALKASGGSGYTAGNKKLVEYVKSIRDQNLIDIWMWTTLSGILLSASRLAKNQSLRIIDWGGGYGNTYFQLSKFIAQVYPVEWHVVELEGNVDVGRKEFETENLKFHTSIEGIPDLSSTTLLLGGVLQYLPDPHALLRDLLARNPMYVVIDRTPMLIAEDNFEIFHIQKSPEALGGSKHPLRILNFNSIQNTFISAGYELLAQNDYGPFPREYSPGHYYAQIWVKTHS